MNYVFRLVVEIGDVISLEWTGHLAPITNIYFKNTIDGILKNPRISAIGLVVSCGPDLTNPNSYHRYKPNLDTLWALFDLADRCHKREIPLSMITTNQDIYNEYNTIAADVGKKTSMMLCKDKEHAKQIVVTTNFFQINMLI